ncbi:hypothetical protein Tco_0119054, partial [Tanacetum coccineum]
MEILKADQIALDDALVAPVNRLKIGKCNLRLSSDATSKEATLQVVYDVLKLTPFYKAFQVSTNIPEIYMPEFWASAYIHNRSSDEDATYVEDQGNEADRDTNANLEGRYDVMADVVLPQSSSVSSGFISNMLNPNQDTGVDDIFRQHTEATSFIDTHITAIVEPSFTRPPTPHPIVIQPQQLPI